MYNAEKTIIRCLNSVFNQTYEANYQIIVINDGSTDNSLQLVQRYLEENALNNVDIVNKSNGGVSTARNSGLELATGDYIALLDSDDCWLPEKTKKQIEILEADQSISMIGCIFDQLRFSSNKLLTDITIKNLIFKNYFQPSTVILRKRIINEVGYFNINQRYAEEGNYFFRICFKNRCTLLNEKLIVYGDGKQGFGEQGLAANIKEMEKGELANLKFALNNKFINLFMYSIAVFYSVIKYIRRIVIVRTKKYA